MVHIRAYKCANSSGANKKEGPKILVAILAHHDVNTLNTQYMSHGSSSPALEYLQILRITSLQKRISSKSQ